MRVLIVEDEIKIRRGLSNLIAGHTKHTVVGEAKNGREGLELVSQHRPDLIITDIRMPVMSGLEMMKVLYEEGISNHRVILSGYSEFDYAKQAIQYGVDDYLIKPLAPEDVTKLLDSIEKKIQKELSRQRVTPEKRLRDFLIGNEEDENDVEKLRLLCGFAPDSSYRIISAYMGNTSREARNICTERFEKIRKKYEDQKIYYFFLDSRQEFICVMEDENWEEIRKELQVKLLDNKLYQQDWVWTENQVTKLAALPQRYHSIREQYLYGMVFGRKTLLNQKIIASVTPKDYHYPKASERKMQKAVYSEKEDKIHKACQEFTEIMRANAASGIMPSQIREGYMKMANFLMSLSQENNSSVYEQLQNLNLVRNIGTAVTLRELEEILEEESRVVIQGLNPREDISNYTIKRAIDYIRQHYQESISLEEVAGSLEITPEYLSTLFNREMGQNFSVFLKKFRISHAKRLLRGTDKRVYEIAQEVGYSDPKYFNRVFKEEEGISPGDYRAL